MIWTVQKTQIWDCKGVTVVVIWDYKQDEALLEEQYWI